MDSFGTHRESSSRKKTALQKGRLSLGLDPQSCQVVVVVEKLYVTDRLALYIDGLDFG